VLRASGRERSGAASIHCSRPYIAGWGEDGALDAIRDYTQTIDAIAHRIEDAIGDSPSTRVGRATTTDSATRGSSWPLVPLQCEMFESGASKSWWPS
jgi:hypothetical protein